MNGKPNVILITIDALRADHLDFMGYRKEISPNIDRLAKESAVFSQAFSVGPNTPHSFPALLTSTYPLDYQGPKSMGEPRRLISEVFKEAGYLTAAFHPNPYLSDYFGYNRGWDFFEYIAPTTNLPTGPGQGGAGEVSLTIRKYLMPVAIAVFSFFPEILFLGKYLLYKLGKLKIVNKVRAAFLNRIVKKFIKSAKKRKEPFFLWVHYIDTHDPYLPYDYYFKERPLSYRELIGKGGPHLFKDDYVYNKFFQRALRKHLKEIISSYDQGIKYVDEQLGELFSFLKEEGVYQNSIICLTSDHGDEFLEHGGTSHSPRLYNELLHVPLLIKTPEGENQKIDKKVSLIDLAPTLTDLIGLPGVSSFKGENLFRKPEKMVFHQVTKSLEKDTKFPGLEGKVACQNNQWKYIFDYGSKKEELYDLSQDPKEQENLSVARPEILFQMKKEIKEFEEKNPPFSVKPKV